MSIMAKCDHVGVVKNICLHIIIFFSSELCNLIKGTHLSARGFKIDLVVEHFKTDLNRNRRKASGRRAECNSK